MVWPNILIALGALLIAVGGVMATHGWNARTEVAQREGLVRAVAAELLVNLEIVSDSKFTEKDQDKLEKFVVFPRMQTVALESAIASGLFLLESDRLLLTRLTGLRQILMDFNQRLSITETQMGNLTAEKIYVYRVKLRDGRTRKSIENKLALLGKLLIKKYDINPDGQFFVQLDEDSA